MPQKIQVGALLLALAACDAGKQLGDQRHPATHQRLLKVAAHEVRLDIWQLPRRKRDAITAHVFSRKVDVVRYHKNRIYFSCLTTAAGCTGYAADIAVRHDTIQVVLNETSDLICTETAVWRVTGEITNAAHKRYVFCK